MYSSPSLVQQEDLRGLEDLRGVDDLRDDLRGVEEIMKVKKVKKTEKIKEKEIKEIKEIKQPIDYNKYYGCIEELLRTNILLNITPITKQKKRKKTKIKRNKIFAALCESSDDDEYSHNTTFSPGACSEDTCSKDINYETKKVKACDPSSIIEHKEDY